MRPIVPVLDYAKHVVFHEVGSLKVERPAKYGGDTSYESYGATERDFAEGRLHPSDLKNAIASELDRIVSPIRAHFRGAEIVSEVLAP